MDGASNWQEELMETRKKIMTAGAKNRRQNVGPMENGSKSGAVEAEVTGGVGKKQKVEENGLLSGRMEARKTGESTILSNHEVAGASRGLRNDQPSRGKMVKRNSSGGRSLNSEASTENHIVSHTREPKPKPTPTPTGKTPTPKTPTQTKPTARKKHPVELENGLVSARVNKPIPGNYHVSEGEVIAVAAPPSEPEQIPSEEPGEVVKADIEDHNVSHALKPKPTPTPMGKTPDRNAQAKSEPTSQRKHSQELESGLVSARVDKPISGNHQQSTGEVIGGAATPSEEPGEVVKANISSPVAAHKRIPEDEVIRSPITSRSAPKPIKPVDNIPEEPGVQNTKVENVSANLDKRTMSSPANRDTAGTQVKKVGSPAEKSQREEAAREKSGTTSGRFPKISRSATLPQVDNVISSVLDEADQERILEQVKSYITEMNPVNFGELTAKIKQFLDAEYGEGWQVAIVKGSYSKTCTHKPKYLLDCVINGVAYLMWKADS